MSCQPPVTCSDLETLNRSKAIFNIGGDGGNVYIAKVKEDHSDEATGLHRSKNVTPFLQPALPSYRI